MKLRNPIAINFVEGARLWHDGRDNTHFWYGRQAVLRNLLTRHNRDTVLRNWERVKTVLDRLEGLNERA